MYIYMYAIRSVSQPVSHSRSRCLDEHKPSGLGASKVATIGGAAEVEGLLRWRGCSGRGAGGAGEVEGSSPVTWRGRLVLPRPLYPTDCLDCLDCLQP
jgi:hypothetical protein